MRLLHQALVLLPLGVSSVYGDLLGPVYPAPRQVSTRGSLVSSSWHNVTAQLDKLTGGKHNSTASALLKNVTFSVGLFSTRDDGAKNLQYHYTSPEIANSQEGLKEVDGDSIYRIASVSKLFTVLAGLLELEPEDWERPLTDVWPQFADFIKDKGDNFNQALDVQWDKVTLSALAAQISGIPRTSIPYTPGDILVNYEAAKLGGAVDPSDDPATYGLPPIDASNSSQVPPCALDPVCTSSLFADGIVAENPVFQPWTSPMYANNNFILLGQAIANLSDKTIDEVYQENIFDPLEMKDSHSLAPKESEYDRYVVPGFANTSLVDGGISKSSGGLYSTTNDYAKFGVAILNSTLLPEDRTRRWMKPISHTSSLRYSVGAPWEIYRYTHTSGVVSDIYTKFGDSGPYTSYLVLFPEFDAGFSVSGASLLPTRGDAISLVTDIVTETLLPALMQQAALEAQRNFAGTYTAKKDGVKHYLKLSIQHTPKAAPGLKLDSWTMNGTNVIEHLRGFGLNPRAKWVPAIQSKGESGQTAFRPYTPTVDDVINGPPTRNLFSSFYDVNDWVVVDAVTYGQYSPINFVFDVEEGKATGVSIPGYRAKLERQK